MKARFINGPRRAGIHAALAIPAVRGMGLCFQGNRPVNRLIEGHDLHMKAAACTLRIREGVPPLGEPRQARKDGLHADVIALTQGDSLLLRGPYTALRSPIGFLGGGIIGMNPPLV